MVALPEQKIGGGIGASEIAAVMGLHPWTSPIEVYLQKIGEMPPMEDNDFTRWGRWMEARIREWYVEKTGARVFVPSESLYHDVYTFLRATPDGIILDDDGRPSAVMDCKVANWRVSDRFGEPGTDDIPWMYYAQLQQQMLVCAVGIGHLEASVGGMPPQTWTVARDEDFIAAIVDDGAEFWRRVQERIPPDVDHTESYRRYLDQKQASEKELAADLHLDALVEDIKDSRERMAASKRYHDLCENQLRERLAAEEAVILYASAGKISWRPQDNGKRPLRYPKGFPAKG